MFKIKLNVKIKKIRVFKLFFGFILLRLFLFLLLLSFCDGNKGGNELLWNFNLNCYQQWSCSSRKGFASVSCWFCRFSNEFLTCVKNVDAIGFHLLWRHIVTDKQSFHIFHCPFVLQINFFFKYRRWCLMCFSNKKLSEKVYKDNYTAIF